MSGFMLGFPPWVAVLSLGLACFGMTVPSAAETSPVLVELGFDEETPTGPDTLRVFELARGRVGLSTAWRVSGYSSLELRDVPGDRDFPELQGYFPEVRDGILFLQLSLLVVDPTEELNVALAGPRGFRPSLDGLSFWLTTRDGHLAHVTDGIPRKIVAIEPFTWYRVTVELDVEAGRYALRIEREGGKVLADLADQPTVTTHPGSAVSVVSLIGDNGDDLSSVVYFVDDLLVARDLLVTQEDPVAPGRRRFFVDRAADAEARAQFARCPQPHGLQEIGVDAAVLDEVALVELQELLGGRRPAEESSPVLEAASWWRRGCDALGAQRFGAAAEAFSRSLELSPDAVASRYGRALADLGLGRGDAVSEALGKLARGDGDPRWDQLAAWSLAKGGDVEEALRGFGEREGEVDPELVFSLYHVGGRHEEALAWAMQRARDAEGDEVADWRFRAGRAAFALRDLEVARRQFRQALEGGASRVPILLALADVAWLEGRVDRERELREEIWGRLDAID